MPDVYEFLRVFKYFKLKCHRVVFLNGTQSIEASQGIREVIQMTPVF